MNPNQLNGDKMSPEQIAAYLKRLELTPGPQLDLDYLTRLHQAHLQHIPFDNLSMLLDEPTTVEHEALFQKLIVQKRGGVCVELNTAYNWLLYSLGFDVTSYNARIYSEAEPIQFRRHRVMGVRLGEKLYLTDVGVNTEFPRRPLLIEEGLTQWDGSCEYKFERHDLWGWVMFQKRPDYDWFQKHCFTEEPQLDLDFITPVFYFEKHPDSVMNKHPRVSIYTADSLYAIRNHAFSQEQHGSPVSSVSFLDEEEERRKIEAFFHLSPWTN